MTSLIDISDICHEICKYIPPIQVMNLIEQKIINYSIERYITYFKLHIIDRLVEIGLSIEEATDFINKLKESKSFLSGSFLLAVLVSNPIKPLEWKPKDLDVYCSKDKGVCKECGDSAVDFSKFSEFMCKYKYHPKNGLFHYTMLSINMNRMWKKDVEINEIILDKKVVDIKQFIFDTFDFDFCKASYDGDQLSVFNIDSIINRKCVYTGDKEALKYFNVKLENKYYGDTYYSNVGDMEYQFRMNRIYSSYTKRKEKYEERGFNITCTFDFGDEYMEDLYTDEKVNTFMKAFNLLIGDNILKNFNIMDYRIRVAFKLNKKDLHLFQGLKCINSVRYDQGYNINTDTIRKIERLIYKHFILSDYIINEHPSAQELVIVLKGVVSFENK